MGVNMLFVLIFLFKMTNLSFKGCILLKLQNLIFTYYIEDKLPDVTSVHVFPLRLHRLSLGEQTQ